ncbi:ATP-binding protein [Streptomyces sp. NPDC006879]|uniref:ATP-binding protein n=1 Tax=Streptomyces sp. NPDC006879 TaxID=3364767 RepID=UPI0036A33142
MSPSTQTDQDAAPPPAVPSAPRALRLSIAADPALVSQVRGAVRAALTSWGVERHADVMELMASELVSNSLQHSGSPDVGVLLEFDEERMILEVTDTSPQRPTPREAREDEVRGRGLFLVEALCTTWGWRHEPEGGKTVWAAFDPSAGTTS